MISFNSNISIYIEFKRKKLNINFTYIKKKTFWSTLHSYTLCSNIYVIQRLKKKRVVLFYAVHTKKKKLCRIHNF